MYELYTSADVGVSTRSIILFDSVFYNWLREK